MGGSKAPANPDPYGFIAQVNAQQTAQNNAQAAQTAVEANRPNVYSPQGSSTWQQETVTDWDRYNADLAAYQASIKGIQDGTDTSAIANFYRQTGTLPTDPHLNPNDDKYSSVKWTNRIELNPTAQQAYDSQQRTELARSQATEDLIAQMRAIYGKDFVAPQRTDYTNGVPGVNTGSVGNLGDFQSDATVNTDIAGALNGVNSVNQNVSQYDPANADKYAQKAYEAQTALLSPTWAQQDSALRNNLALRGLSVGSEAEQGAQQAALGTRALQQNAIAADSYNTGNANARADYASYLSGLGAQNAAQQQAYTQALGTFTTGNQAQQQQLQQDLSKYGANIDQLKTNAALQQAQNQAQAQAYSQAMNNYGTDWQAALAERARPVNEMNALLYGQQVEMPLSPSFATQQTVGGADQNSAYNSWLQNTNSYNSAQAAASANNTQAATSLVGAGLGAWGAAAGAGLVAFF